MIALAQQATDFGAVIIATGTAYKELWPARGVAVHWEGRVMVCDL